MLEVDPIDPDTATQPCRFSHAIQSRKCSCAHAQRLRKNYEVVTGCRDAESRAVCAQWLALVKRASKFALGQQREPAALRRSRASQLQLGGLLGLGDTLDLDSDDRIKDVSALLNRARKRFGGLDRVPMDVVVRSVHRNGGHGGER